MQYSDEPQIVRASGKRWWPRLLGIAAVAAVVVIFGIASAIEPWMDYLREHLPRGPHQGVIIKIEGDSGNYAFEPDFQKGHMIFYCDPAPPAGATLHVRFKDPSFQEDLAYSAGEKYFGPTQKDQLSPWSDYKLHLTLKEGDKVLGDATGRALAPPSHED